MKTSTLNAVAAFSAFTRMGLTSAAQDGPVLQLSDDESFHFEILTGMGQVLGGAADAGAVLGAAHDIIPGDWDSFTQVWTDLANATKAKAMDPEFATDPINVRETWFSAATYFRRADVYVRADWDDPRIDGFWDEQMAAFDKAMASLPVPGQRVRIPADGFTVEAIWFGQTKTSISGNCTQRGRTLILGNGFDAAQEDLYATVVAPALDRGWNVMTFEGPGQPTVRRYQGLGFIPHWERVLTPVVDYLLSAKAACVDPDRLALFGNSFGGYLDARAAAFEPRISALMLDGGVWDAYEGYTSNVPSDLLALHEAGEREAFDEAVLAIVNNDDDTESGDDITTTLKWGVLQGLWSFKTKSPYDFLEMLKAYTLEGITDRIQMPVWIADAEFEHAMVGQSQKVKDALGDLATLHLFEGSAGYHCQVGAPQELSLVMFAWLDKTLGKA